MILALLVRGFEAEAFVIPTGSMAPTLMGRHKEITCPQCGYVYSVNASEEVEGFGRGEPAQPPGLLGDLRQLPVPGAGRRRAELQGGPHPGDEVPLRHAVPAGLLAARSAGTWSSSATPRSPRSATSSGSSACPARTLEVYYGDVYIKPPGGKEFQLARKPLRHQQAMQMMVYDDRHRADGAGERPRVAAMDRVVAAGGLDRGRVDGDARALHRRRRAGEGRVGRAALPPPRPRPRAVGRDRQRPRAAPAAPPDPDHRLLLVQHQPDRRELQPGRLSPRRAGRGLDAAALGRRPDALGAGSKVNAPGGSVRFELVEGGVVNRCEIDLATGKATLRHGDKVLGEQPSRDQRAGDVRRQLRQRGRPPDARGRRPRRSSATAWPTTTAPRTTRRRPRPTCRRRRSPRRGRRSR